jgi:catechol 2,3-dioxygenase-like lactoylglutathione lyase family enzyme
MSFRIVAADHTGITVSDLEQSLTFWRDVLGFELSHRAHQKGELAEQITGVPGAEILIAVVKAPATKSSCSNTVPPPIAKGSMPDPAMSVRST